MENFKKHLEQTIPEKDSLKTVKKRRKVILKRIRLMTLFLWGWNYTSQRIFRSRKSESF